MNKTLFLGSIAIMVLLTGCALPKTNRSSLEPYSGSFNNKTVQEAVSAIDSYIKGYSRQLSIPLQSVILDFSPATAGNYGILNSKEQKNIYWSNTSFTQWGTVKHASGVYLFIKIGNGDYQTLSETAECMAYFVSILQVPRLGDQYIPYSFNYAFSPAIKFKIKVDPENGDIMLSDYQMTNIPAGTNVSYQCPFILLTAFTAMSIAYEPIPGIGFTLYSKTFRKPENTSESFRFSFDSKIVDDTATASDVNIDVNLNVTGVVMENLAGPFNYAYPLIIEKK